MLRSILKRFPRICKNPNFLDKREKKTLYIYRHFFLLCELKSWNSAKFLAKSGKPMSYAILTSKNELLARKNRIETVFSDLFQHFSTFWRHFWPMIKIDFVYKKKKFPECHDILGQKVDVCREKWIFLLAYTLAVQKTPI